MKDAGFLEGVLVCPVTHERLRFTGQNWRAYESGRTYRVVDGVPVLRDGPEPVRIASDHASNAMDPAIWERMSAGSAPVLFLGAGTTGLRADAVVEVEYNLFRNTDVIADAHALPLADGAFGCAVALNVFEHLADPRRAAAELLRILRPGGELLIQTAFLQPLHEPPHHYYNATEFGVARWFCDFAELRMEVTPNFSPAFNLSWMLSDALLGIEHYGGAQEATRAGGTTIAEAAAFWRSRTQSPFSEALFQLPDEFARRLAGGFQVTARKPQTPAHDGGNP